MFGIDNDNSIGMSHVVAASRLRSRWRPPAPEDTQVLQEEEVNKYYKRIIFWKIVKTGQYVLAFLVLAGFFIIQCIQLVEKFQSKPTYMENAVLNQVDTEFPEFTFCPLDSGYKADVLASHGIMKATDYWGTKNHTWHSKEYFITPQQLFQDATYELTDLLRKIKVRTIRGETLEENHEASGDSTFYPKINLDYKDEIFNFRTSYHRRMGRCYSAYPGPKISSKLGIYFMIMYLNEGIKIYFHHRRQYLDSSGRMGIKVNKGEKIQLQANWALFEMLEEDTLMGYNCKKEPPYDTCMYKAITEMMKEEANCTVPWVPDNKNICKNDEDRNFSYWKHYKHITNQKYTCPNPCNFLRVNMGSMNRQALPSNNTQLYIYFQSRIMASQESLLVTTLELAAEIGGYLDLFLGVSFFTFAGLLKKLIDRHIRRLSKNDQTKAEEIIAKRIEELKDELISDLDNNATDEYKGCKI